MLRGLESAREVGYEKNIEAMGDGTRSFEQVDCQQVFPRANRGDAAREKREQWTVGAGHLLPVLLEHRVGEPVCDFADCDAVWIESVVALLPTAVYVYRDIC